MNTVQHLPATGAGAGTTLAWRWDPNGCPPAEAERGRFRPRLNLLNRGWALSSSCSGSVRGLKCLHRHDFIFNSIWLRSVEEGEGGKTEEELLSEVFVSEVLANLSVAGEREVAEGGGDAGGGRSSVSGSSPWKTLPCSVCALSSNTLRDEDGVGTLVLLYIQVEKREKHTKRVTGRSLTCRLVPRAVEPCPGIGVEQ